MDEALNKESVKKEDSSGCTAVSVIIKGTKIYCVSSFIYQNAALLFSSQKPLMHRAHSNIDWIHDS